MKGAPRPRSRPSLSKRPRPGAVPRLLPSRSRTCERNTGLRIGLLVRGNGGFQLSPELFAQLCPLLGVRLDPRQILRHRCGAAHPDEGQRPQDHDRCEEGLFDRTHHIAHLGQFSPPRFHHVVVNTCFFSHCENLLVLIVASSQLLADATSPCRCPQTLAPHRRQSTRTPCRRSEPLPWLCQC